LDHDMKPDGILVPFGILEVKQKQFNVIYGIFWISNTCTV